MLLLISDANILIDIEVGGLLASMFSLGFEFGVPDILYYEELEAQHAHLLALGLHSMEMEEAQVRRVEALARTYAKPSRNDLFALVLAQRQQCPLLSGDEALREAALSEGLDVKGTLWLVEQMIRQQKISVHVARSAYQMMREQGRRLPWGMAEQRLAELEEGREP